MYLIGVEDEEGKDILGEIQKEVNKRKEDRNSKNVFRDEQSMLVEVIEIKKGKRS